MVASVAILCAALAVPAERVHAALVAYEPELSAGFQKLRAPGMAFGVVKDGELIYFKAFGVRDVEAKAPVDLDSVFRIASMTKAFTSAAALKLRDEGKLQLDDPAEKVLPELKALKYPTADSPKITLRLLLSHSAGLPEDNASADLRMSMSDGDFAAMLAPGLSFSSAPGTQFEYANLGFALAGRIVSKVAGEPVQSYIGKNLLAPLGMSASGFSPPEKNRAKGYGRKGSQMPASGLTKYDDDAFHEEASIADGSWAALGGLWTTPRDYAKWVAFQLAAWPPRDGEDGPVRRASLREAQSVQRFARFGVEREASGALLATAFGYGFGWGVAQSCSFDRVVAHSGGLPGYGSYVMLLPDEGVGAFAMVNLTYTGGAALVRRALEKLQAQGLLPKRRAQPSPQLLAIRDGAAALYAKFDAALLERIADRTYFVYMPPERLAKQLAALREAHGACHVAGDFEAENALRGTQRLECEHGRIDLSLTLTAEVPAKIQSVAYESFLPPAGPLTEIADRALQLTQNFSDERLAALVAGGVDRAAFKAAAGRLRDCKRADPLKSDGVTFASFKAECRGRAAVLDLALDEKGSGKLGKLSLEEAREGRCPK